MEHDLNSVSYHLCPVLIKKEKTHCFYTYCEIFIVGALFSKYHACMGFSHRIFG
jgi:hypothetical protein